MVEERARGVARKEIEPKPTYQKMGGRRPETRVEHAFFENYQAGFVRGE